MGIKKEKNSKNKPRAAAQSKAQIEQAAKKLLEPEIAGLGYEIWDLEYYSADGQWQLEITIENPSGVPISFEDCEKVTRAVTPVLDREDPIENSYCLAVGSPGLNRELKNAGQLKKYTGKEVTVKLFAKNELAGDKSFEAVLKEAGGPEGDFVFELAGAAALTLKKNEIAHIYARDEIDI
ncbi:MAG: ribosome maturation factor RimP [Oscillospiraceae bacterium]|nr:ribosome maturation factor RimP [Oscillospiraceae bacterium]